MEPPNAARLPGSKLGSYSLTGYSPSYKPKY